MEYEYNLEAVIGKILSDEFNESYDKIIDPSKCDPSVRDENHDRIIALNNALSKRGVTIIQELCNDQGDEPSFMYWVIRRILIEMHLNSLYSARIALEQDDTKIDAEFINGSTWLTSKIKELSLDLNHCIKMIKSHVVPSAFIEEV